LIPVARVRWQTSHRIIPTRFPATDLFASVAPASDWDDLEGLANLTNPRVKQSDQGYGLFPESDLPPERDRSLVMAPFMHVNPAGGRFSDGTFGVYYAAHSLETAVHETVHHRRLFAQHSRLPAMIFNMNVLEAAVNGRLHDLRDGRAPKGVLAADDYTASKALAVRLYAKEKSEGIVYPSVRHEGGVCIAVFRPKVLSQAKRTALLNYIWDGVDSITIARLDVMKTLKG
jgi:RES domain-containing protein